MRKKKKGASMVMLVFITALIFAMGTSMLAVVSTDYRTRINQSRKLQNLYQSDAGVQIINNAINKNADAAIAYANYNVKENINNRVPSTFTDEEINEMFKRYFIDFLATSEVDQTANLSTNNMAAVEADKLNNILLYGVLKTSYIVPDALIGITTDYEEQIRDLSSNAYKNATWNNIGDNQSGGTTNKESKIDIIECKIENVKDKHNIYLKIRSTFNTEVSNITEYTNLKTIETSFTINAPEYSQSVETNSDYVLIKGQSVLKAITADGNLYAENCGNVNIYGDIWVNGRATEINDPVYDKYRSGIFIKDNNFSMGEGNIYTPATVNIVNNAKLTMAEDIYALNVNVGKTDVTGDTGDNLLLAKNLITNNDLTLNAFKSNIFLENFYGINDITESNQDNHNNIMNSARNSSSIIVNGSSNSLINVTNDAYIMGVAYLNTSENKYQTGESVAVKGNYNAYINVKDGTNGIEMRQYNGPNSAPMVFTIDGQNSAQAKAKYFVGYYNKNGTGDLNFGGVNINKVHATGAVVNNGNVTYSNTSVEDDEYIKTFKRDFATEVFGMGTLRGIPGLGEIDDSNREVKGLMAYNNNIVAKKVYSTDESVAQSQINFAGMSRFVPTGTNANENYGKIVLNPDENMDIIIESGVIKVKNASGNYDIVEATPTTNNPNNSIQAVIVTKGNVEIKGAVNYEGSIIAAGDVKFTGAGDKNIYKTDTITRDVVNTIIAKYYVSQDLNNIFIGTPMSVDLIYVPIRSYYQINNVNSEIYDADKYLRRGLWKLVH